MPIVIPSAGSSTITGGSAFGSSSAASVSPIVISGMPATAMISPGPASSAGRRVMPSVMYSSVIFACVKSSNSWRYQATVSPLRIVPLCTRHSARRPT